MHDAGLDGETFDYGLAPGESFEPDDHEPVSRDLPHIMTVLGPVEPGALGVTNMSASFTVPEPDDRPSNEVASTALLREIEEAGYVGLGALVDLRPLRDPESAEHARWLAGRSDLHLIVATGPLDPAGPRQIVDRIIAEGTHGIGDTGVIPGLIVSPLHVASLSVAGEARLATGLPLIVAAAGAKPVDILRRIAEASIDPAGTVVIGATRDYRLLFEAGASVLIEVTEAGGKASAAQALLVTDLVRNGFAEHIVLGCNPQFAPQTLSYGYGSRWSYLIEQFPVHLLEAGLDALTVRSLLIENPNRLLTIEPPGDPTTAREKL